MKIKKITISTVIIYYSLFAINTTLNAQTERDQPKQKYDIAAFVWPSYHPDDRAKIFWPDGIGEWQIGRAHV